MGKITLVTGGARSGKSTFAEDSLRKKKRVLYIATAVAYDEEMKERIRLHKRQRPDTWQTLEAYDRLDEKIPDLKTAYDGILLDCVTVMLTNLLFSQEGFDEEGSTEEFWREFEYETLLKINKLLQCARSMTDHFILVTNEIGMGLVPETAFSRRFRDMAGRINQMIAKESDEVCLVVSGIPMMIKGGDQS